MRMKVYKYAAEHGQIPCLEFIRRTGLDWSELVTGTAAECGQLEAIRYLRDHGCEWDERAMTYAANGGHLSCLQYGLENGCPLDPVALEWALRGGHLDCVKLLHQHGEEITIDEACCYYAARGGNLECLKYLRDVGCPWDARTPESAVQSDCLPALQFCLEHDCPCDIQRLIRVASELFSGASCLSYLLQLLPGTRPLGAKELQLLDAAYRRGNYSSAHCLLLAGCPFKEPSLDVLANESIRSDPSENKTKDKALLQCLIVATQNQGFKFSSSFIEHLGDFTLMGCAEYAGLHAKLAP